MKEFLFGVATAATQIEGGYDQDGKGMSIWDEYSKKGLIQNGHTCFVTCDSYNRLEEDLDLLKELGVNAYRFSLAWPRIQPKGYGEVNPKGIEYYNKLIDGLLARGIKPVVTLFHWDMPVELDRQGGFSNRKIVDRFEEYARIVAENFGDRVEMFSVFNEAASIIDFLYIQPVGCAYPPKSNQEAFEAMHNLLLCYAAGTYALKKYSKLDVKVGMVGCSDIKMPKTENDIEAARRAMFMPGNAFYACNTTWWDPIMFGTYNEELVKKFNLDLSFIQDGDMEYINCKQDFMGMNIYLGTTVEAGEDGNPIPSSPSLNASYGDMGEDVRRGESSMYWGPKFMQERYGLPVYVTESGISLNEWIDLDGQVNDPVRVDYIRRYFKWLKKAKTDGIDVRGYFYWTLMDNFEWSSGFKRRFGLVYSDFETGNRIKKQSFYAYKKLIEENKE